MDEWPIIMPRLGFPVDHEPDREAPAGRHWENYKGYGISLQGTKLGGQIDFAKITEFITNTLTFTETLEPHDQLRLAVASVLGVGNRDVARLSQFDWNPDDAEIAVIFAADDLLFESMIKFGIQSDITDILRTIHTSDTSLPFESIAVVATFPLKDVYGNTSTGSVVKATYDREKLDRVNWTGFNLENIYTIANQDDLFVHRQVR